MLITTSNRRRRRSQIMFAVDPKNNIFRHLQFYFGNFVILGTITFTSRLLGECRSGEQNKRCVFFSRIIHAHYLLIPEYIFMSKVCAKHV